MNSRQLAKLGVPGECFPAAIAAIQKAAQAEALRHRDIKKLLPQIVAAPSQFVDDLYFGEFAEALLAADAPYEAAKPISYRTWGDAGIDPNAHVQMQQACSLPMAAGA